MSEKTEHPSLEAAPPEEVGEELPAGNGGQPSDGVRTRPFRIFRRSARWMSGLDTDLDGLLTLEPPPSDADVGDGRGSSVEVPAAGLNGLNGDAALVADGLATLAEPLVTDPVTAEPSQPSPATPHRTAGTKCLTVTVVVPATDRPATLGRCVAAIRAAQDPPEEVIVVERSTTSGASGARNEGAAEATGDLLLFVDADVLVRSDAIRRIRAAFERDADLTALFGSYDDGLPTNGAVATFRNLLHHHIHHTCAGPATTFWSGLGAVRREAFVAAGGFDAERFDAPSVEDIDLGMRLSAGGARIVLDPAVQGTHLKDWRLWDMVCTDFLRRGVPWVGLLLRNPGGRPRTTLNLSWTHRLSALSSLVGVGALIMRRPLVAAGAMTALLTLNGRFYLLLARRHGVRTSGIGVALHVIHHLTSIAAVPMGIIVHLREARKRRDAC